MTHGVGLAAWSSDCICEVSSVECSASMNSQSNPASAISSATAGELRVINGAKSGLARSSRVLNDCAIRANVIQIVAITEETEVTEKGVNTELTGDHRDHRGDFTCSHSCGGSPANGRHRDRDEAAIPSAFGFLAGAWDRGLASIPAALCAARRNLCASSVISVFSVLKNSVISL